MAPMSVDLSGPRGHDSPPSGCLLLTTGCPVPAQGPRCPAPPSQLLVHSWLFPRRCSVAPGVPGSLSGCAPGVPAPPADRPPRALLPPLPGAGARPAPRWTAGSQGGLSEATVPISSAPAVHVLQGARALPPARGLLAPDLCPSRNRETSAHQTPVVRAQGASPRLPPPSALDKKGATPPPPQEGCRHETPWGPQGHRSAHLAPSLPPPLGPAWPAPLHPAPPTLGPQSPTQLPPSVVGQWWSLHPSLTQDSRLGTGPPARLPGGHSRSAIKVVPCLLGCLSVAMPQLTDGRCPPVPWEPLVGPGGLRLSPLGEGGAGCRLWRYRVLPCDHCSVLPPAHQALGLNRARHGNGASCLSLMATPP